MDYEEIDIYWEGPFDITYENEKYHLSSDVCDELREAHGFYQIYGDHPVYGQNVLLYIGETKPSLNNERGFAARMKEHFSGRFWHHCGLSVRFGRSFINGLEVIDTKTICAIESLLIASNMPALNKDFLDNSNDNSLNMIVRNWNFRGSIVSECSGKYWAKR
ncbi:hypothetical protein [Aliivibrio fischeri]|uniref:hypothetical protein n=1 Tax=Aliivibrio fischeri TaxID=668 RepID=UPI0012D8660E|nr:hypothetical protein [Aliivibrio fischeri]MUJ21709.1 hypothetical protein [Aliivibrio fischeri]